MGKPKGKKRGGGSRWNVLTDREEESVKQAARDGFYWTAQDGSWEGKRRFQWPHCGGRSGRGGCANVVLSPAVLGSGQLPMWTVGCKVAHSLINKVKFVSRRCFWSKSWRRGQNLPELNSLEMHAEGLFSSPPGPSAQVCLIPAQCLNTLVGWPKAGWVGVGKKEPKGPGSCSMKISHTTSLQSKEHCTPLP